MTDPPRTGTGRSARAVLVVALALVLVVAGNLIGWRLAGADTVNTAVGEVSFELRPSLRGDAEAFVPLADWGFRADAFDAPFDVRAELRTLDRPALLAASEGDISLLAETEDDLEAGFRAAVMRPLAWGLGVTLVLLGAATLIWRRLRPRWALLAAGGAIELVAVGASLWALSSTFDARAFETPTYFARGGELRRILEVAEDERVESEYGSTFASILRSVSAVLVEPSPGPGRGRDLFAASDLHGNPVVIDPLARWIDGAPLLLVGDYGQRGGEAESRLLAPRVAALSDRVVAVSGNHDTRGLMERFAGEGVRVLDQGTLTRVDGLLVAGYPDPLQWDGEGDPESRPITFEDLPDPDAAFEAELSSLVAWLERLSPRPDVVMVHQSGLARGLAESLLERGEAKRLTIVTGHSHVQRVERYGDVVVVDGGTVGAGGVFGAGRAPAGFAQLHFAADRPELRSVDLIAVEPFSGRAQASRVVVDGLCPGEEECTYEPPGQDLSGIE